MHERPLVLAHHDARKRAGHEDREDLEQHVLVAAERERRRVHHAQILDDRLVERERRITPRIRVLDRIRRDGKMAPAGPNEVDELCGCDLASRRGGSGSRSAPPRESYGLRSRICSASPARASLQKQCHSPSLN